VNSSVILVLIKFIGPKEFYLELYPERNNIPITAETLNFILFINYVMCGIAEKELWCRNNKEHTKNSICLSSIDYEFIYLKYDGRLSFVIITTLLLYNKLVAHASIMTSTLMENISGTCDEGNFINKFTHFFIPNTTGYRCYQVLQQSSY